MRTLLMAAALVAAIAGPAAAQIGNLHQLPFPPRHASLVHVRFLGPPGMHVTLFQGNAKQGGYDFAAPVNVGLRPGYIHRARLSGFANRPGLILSPSVELLDALCLPPHQATARYPVPIWLSEQDIERIADGRYITKVVYLEDPEKAMAVPTKPDEPMETELMPDRDPLFEARQIGRPMLIMRIGTRDLSDKELMANTVPETILMPGQAVLGTPPVPPCLPWAGKRIYDPILGARPATEECLHDGGDAGWPAGVDGAGNLGGVEPADTVAEYRDSSGRLRVTKSNRVCLCVPRFGILRAEVPLHGFNVTLSPAGAEMIQGQGEVGLRLPPRLAQQQKPPIEVEGLLRPSINISTQAAFPLIRLDVLQAMHIDLGLGVVLGVKGLDQLTQIQRIQIAKQLELARDLSVFRRTGDVETVVGTAVLGRIQGLDVVSQTMETRDLTVCCNEPPRPPDKPLVLWKWADKTCAQIGDVVTFTLKYTNHGGRPMTDIAVVDSLTGRLEYIPGSAKSSRDAVFTLQENEAGSGVLRWEVSGALQPGQSAVVSFQTKIR